MFQAQRNIALVVNPFHAKAREAARELMARLQDKGIEHTLFTESWPAAWIDFTEAWVVGGDGTLNYFINRYPQFKMPIALFKGGAGNAFHRLLYGDISIKQQIEVVLTAVPQSLDAGLCNNRLFIHGVGIGFTGKIAKDLTGKNKGKTTILFTIVKNIFRYRSFLCTVNTTGFHWGKKCFMISVANGKQYGGSGPGSENLLKDGLLDTDIVGRIHPLRRLRYLPVIENGKQPNLPFITYVKSSMVIVKALQEIPAHADGETFAATEFNIECLPGRFLFLYNADPLRPSFGK